MELREKIDNLPKSPGVYIMKDKSKNILYIGKSKSLATRVKSYFHSSGQKMYKIQQMVKQVADVDHLVTDTELEALLLECEMIKKHQPPYNRMMKNETNYCYLKVKEDKNKKVLSLDYDTKDRDANYYGPYKSRSMVEKLQGFFQSLSPILKDKDRGNYVFEYHPIPSVDQREEMIHNNNICTILERDHKVFIKDLEEKMHSHARELQFERAKFYQEGIKLLEYVEKIKKFSWEIREEECVLAMEPLDKKRIKSFLIRGNEVIYKKIMDFESLEDEETLLNLENIVNKIITDHPVKKDEWVRKESLDPLFIVNSYLHSEENPMVFMKINKDHLSLKKNLKALDERMRI